MSNVVSITVKNRDSTGSASSRRLRRSGFVPAVLYGKAEEPVSLTVSAENANVLQSHTGLIRLSGGSLERSSAIVKELTLDPLTGKILHMDLLAVKADQVIVVPVPVVTTGEPAGAMDGGMLEQLIREIEVECLPASVPEAIVVDVSELQLDESITARDIQLEEGVKIVAEDDLLIVQVRIPRMEAEEDEEAEEVLDAVEAAEAGEEAAAEDESSEEA